MKVDQGWALQAPGKHLVAETFSAKRYEAMANGFNWLESALPREFGNNWALPWEAVRRRALRRGWRVVRARVVLANGKRS